MNNLVLLALAPFFFLYCVLSQYKVMQSYHYEIKKYFKYNCVKKIFVLIIGIVTVGTSFFVNSFDKYVMFGFMGIIFNLIMIEKGKLKLTNRVKRFLLIYIISMYLLMLIPIDKVWILLSFGLLFYPHLLVIHKLSCFVENVIMIFYVKDAQKIIKNKKVIGVTGSYGKTSCKNIIYDMLSTFVNVSKTPKSYNNKVGIVKGIRENVNIQDEYFICEYGVDTKGAMNKLLNIVKPNISLITEVGPQHLLTFKNIENIVNEKIKIAKVLKEDEYVIINNDNVYLREKSKELRCKVITYGIKNKSYIMAKNIIIGNNGSTFDLYIKGKKYKTLKINLLGEHNVLNVLGSIGVLKAMQVDLECINLLVSKIKPIEHRLELKTLQGVKIIDDSFNSNEVGFKKAVDILSMMNEEKYIITPGIIEQGQNSEVVNYELGKYMASKIDYAILVEENANILKEGLLASDFDNKKIIIKKDFIEAWDYVKSIKDDNKIILIENDLPSIYLK